VRFHLEQLLPGSRDDVVAAFVDPAFYASLDALPKIEPPELLEQVIDGTTVRQRIRYRFTGHVSGAVTRVIDPQKMVWVDESTYDLAAYRAEFKVVPEHYANKLTCGGSYAFEASGDATRRVIDGELRVHVPLVNRPVERAIVSGLEEHLADEARLMGDWLNAGPKTG
jgi:hypothetical protein